MPKNSILYIVNFYGTPPLNFFSKYLKENTTIDLYVVKLPAVSFSKGKWTYEAFILEPQGSIKKIAFEIPNVLPNFVFFFLQYLVNLAVAIPLIHKTDLRKFDVGVGETNFGAFVIQLLRLFGYVRKTVFMSGDILPIFDHKIIPYYFGSTNKFVELLDKSFTFFQLGMRKVGIRCNKVWYATTSVKSWDESNGLIAKNYFIAPAVTVDSAAILAKSFNTSQAKLLGYIGRLDEHAGMDMALRVMQELKLRGLNINLLVVGGSPAAVEKYKNIAEQLGIQDIVEFKGFVEHMSDAIALLNTTDLGLALYKPDKHNVSLYADVSKPKEYIKAGIPVIITKASTNSAEGMIKLNGAVEVEDDVKPICDAIQNTLFDRVQYESKLAGVRAYSKTCDYKETFKQVTREITELFPSL